jgi:dienelactone hydrolase
MGFSDLPGPPGQAEKPVPRKELPPFLDTFRTAKDTIRTREVRIVTAVGTVQGYLARHDTPERLPALLLLYNGADPGAWMRTNGRDLAGIGYVVLVLDLEKSRARVAGKQGEEQLRAEEATLAELSAAVRWLRRQPEVLPEQVGVIGWGWAAEPALAVAAALALEGCVLVDRVPALSADRLAGLRRTAVLGLYAGRDARTQRLLPTFRKALTAAHVVHKLVTLPDVDAGFLGPPEGKPYAHAAAERAWVEMYEFLGKHVEDAPQNGPVPGAAKVPIATIADLMKAVCQPAGVRGGLIAALKEKPASARQWQGIRARAALLAETGRLLEERTPPHGSRADWKKRTGAFAATAATIVHAADKQDYAGARRGLEVLGKSCAACHDRHR